MMENNRAAQSAKRKSDAFKAGTDETSVDSGSREHVLLVRRFQVGCAWPVVRN